MSEQTRGARTEAAAKAIQLHETAHGTVSIAWEWYIELAKTALAAADRAAPPAPPRGDLENALAEALRALVDAVEQNYDVPNAPVDAARAVLRDYDAEHP